MARVTRDAVLLLADSQVRETAEGVREPTDAGRVRRRELLAELSDLRELLGRGVALATAEKGDAETQASVPIVVGRENTHEQGTTGSDFQGIRLISIWQCPF